MVEQPTPDVFKQASPLDDIGDVGPPIAQDNRKEFGPASGPTVLNTVADSFAPQGGGTGASAIGTALQEMGGPARFATPLDDIGDIAPTEVSATGAAARGAIRGAAPAAGALAAAGAGAELGGAVGSVGGPIGAAVGGFVGGVGGAIAGGAAVDKAQSWLLSKLPDSFVDAWGQSERQQRLDQQERPVASFVGGMLPFALTMQPTKLLTGAAALPEGATALQRLMANPVTARLFGGGVMGGMELGQEAAQGEIDWRKIGIATGFGIVFNKPNRLGEAITEMGGAPSRRILGRPSPTIAQAGDAKILGPGITESVFQGTHEQAPEAAMTAQEAARSEQAALGEIPEPNVVDVARQMEPELFARYDELQNRQKLFGAQTGPNGEEIPALTSHLEATKAELDKLSTEISAAYRRAADTIGVETVEAPQFKSFAEMIAAHERGPAGPAAAPKVTRSLDERLDALGVERNSLATEEHLGRPNVKVPKENLALHEALSVASLPGWNPERAAEAAKWAIENGRPDIAQAIADRGRRWAETMGVTPGVAKENPKYETIAADLENRKRQAIKDADALQKIAQSGVESGIPGVPSGGAAPGVAAGPAGAPGAGAPSAPRAIGDQRAFIAEDVARRLIAAGRPEDEARAAGQLVAARYVTRAGRFEGKLGSAEELYARDSAAIAGPGQKAMAPATPPREAYEAAGPAQREASAAAEAPARELAAKPASEPGVIAKDFDTADRVKAEWRKAAPFKDTEQFVEASWHNQRTLAETAEQIGAELGLTFKNPGIKARTKADIASIADEAKRAKAETGRARLETKAKKHGIGGVTDQVRGGFDVPTPEKADQALAELGKKFQIIDEGWYETPDGYFDRKAYVRFPDGMIGELQFWPPGMLEAKGERGGHALYEQSRELPPGHPDISGFRQKMRDLYASVRADLPAEWKAVLGSGGNEPNLLPKAAGESTLPSEPTSAALASDHLPPENTQASEALMKNGSPSNEPALMADMFGPPEENVGARVESVNASISAADKINSLTPAEQKRELPAYSSDKEATPQGEDKPAGVFMFQPTALNVDAKRFQFKSGGDEYGVTGALRNVTKWDPAKAQAIIVWEQADGTLFVADGHQRAGLARRLTEQGKAKDIQLPGILYREKDGISADDIRAIAAVTNIANGSGSALDGAKVLRARPDLMDGSLPLSVGKGKQAAALARLGDEPFRMVVNDVVPEHYGAVVGELIPHDPERQTAALKAIARFEPKNADEAAVLTQRVAQAELAKREEGAQTSMFGDLETKESTAGEEMKIVGRAIADLKKDKALFARVLRNAARIEETGSQIQREAAQSIATDAEVFAKTLTSEAYSAGPIRQELIAAARELKDGKSTIGEASARIVAALRAQAEAHGADRVDTSGQPEREFAQRDLLDYEEGAEGKPQSLLPGVKPVSQRDLIQAAANKPMAPKKAQKAADLGLFGSEKDQKELFQHSEPVRLTGEMDVAKVKTGQPVEFNYIHNTNSAAKAMGIPTKESPFGRGYEPSGKYVRVASETAKVPEHLQTGEMTLFNPLVIENDNLQWKQKLSESYGGKTGKELSKALIADGYDGVITTEKDHISEVLDLQSFDEAKALYQIARGKIRVGSGRPLITLLKDANPSTFIHETGHEWLEQMVKDSGHADAPDVIKQDMQIIRDWFGLADGADIQTKHHEKFARGFEQYLREGVAPSKGLAKVFSDFRNWLLTIYQSLKGLGPEISPEIRGVFDRMLEMEPQRTVIAPERLQPDLLHDIHEAEAVHTPPHEAEPAMDRIIAERDRYISEQSPEIQRELEAAAQKVQAAEGPAGEAAGTPGEAFASPSGSEQVGEGGGGPGSEPGGGGGGPEHGPEQRGGGTAGTEGAAGPKPDLRSELGRDAGTALAPGPKDLFGRESPYTDRAGNIRLENLTNSADVRQAIHDAADENNDFIGDRRGVVTDGQVSDLANDIGLPGAMDLVSKWVKGQAYNAEQVVILRRLLRSSAIDLSAKMKQAAIGSDQDVMAYAEARDRHQLIQRTVAGATAEAGRALRAFRNIAGEEGTAAKAIDELTKIATGKTLFQLRAEAKLGAKLDTPEKVSRFMQDAQKRNFGRGVLEYFVNALISGPITHITYGVGNELSSILRAGPETLAAAAIGKVRQALGREGAVVHAGEALAQYRARYGTIPASIQSAMEAARTGMTTLLPGEEIAPGHGALTPFEGDSNLVTARSMTNAPVSWNEAMGSAFGAVRGIKDAFTVGGTLNDRPVGLEYSPLGQIPDIRVGSVNIPIGTAIRLPGRLVAAEHSFFRMANYAMERSAEAYRIATDEGLTGEARNQRIAQIELNPTEEQMNRWIQESTHATLMGQGGAFVRKLSAMLNHEFNVPGIGPTPLLKFIDPFTKISGNIIDQSLVHRTPIGLLSPEIRADLMGKNGTVAQDKAQARMLIGTGLAILSGSLASQGYVTGSGPSDPKEAAVWRMTGNQPHSVRIGDFYYEVNKLGPYGVLLGITADLYEVAHEASDGDMLKAAMHLQHAFTQNILDESFMKGPSDLIKAVDDPGRYGENYLKSFASSLTPFSSGLYQINRLRDPYQRETRSVVDAIKTKIPGLSETLMPRRDIWGQELPNRQGAGYLTSIYMQKVNGDPVNQALLDAQIFPGKVEKKIRNIELTPEEYDDFAKVAGVMTKQNLDRLILSPSWDILPLGSKQLAIKHVVETCRETARGIIMARYPHIPRDAAQQKIETLTTGKKK